MTRLAAFAHARDEWSADRCVAAAQDPDALPVKAEPAARHGWESPARAEVLCGVGPLVTEVPGRAPGDAAATRGRRPCPVEPEYGEGALTYLRMTGPYATSFPWQRIPDDPLGALPTVRDGLRLNAASPEPPPSVRLLLPRGGHAGHARSRAH